MIFWFIQILVVAVSNFILNDRCSFFSIVKLLYVTSEGLLERRIRKKGNINTFYKMLEIFLKWMERALSSLTGTNNAHFLVQLLRVLVLDVVLFSSSSSTLQYSILSSLLILIRNSLEVHFIKPDLIVQPSTSI